MNSINAINRAAGIKNANESELFPYPPSCMGKKKDLEPADC